MYFNSTLTTGFKGVADVTCGAVAVLTVECDFAEGIDPASQGARVAARAGPALLVHWAVRVGDASNCDEGRDIIIPYSHWRFIKGRLTLGSKAGVATTATLSSFVSQGFGSPADLDIIFVQPVAKTE